MTALPPAVVDALKAADEIAARAERASSIGPWCAECHRDWPMHNAACPVGRYIAARKEIDP